MSTVQVGQINSTDGSTAITTGAGGTVTLSAALTGTDATLSGGVYLGGTGAANRLDDYEEGTWTPAVTAGLSSVTYVNQDGYYIKIGNYCFFRMRLEVNTATQVAARLKVSLPLTAKNLTSPAGTATFAYQSNIVSGTTTNLPMLWIAANTSVIDFYKTDASSFNGTDLVSGGADYYLAGHYEVA